MLKVDDLSGHVNWFARFVDGYLTGHSEDDENLLLKREHSFRVLEEARAMIGELPRRLADQGLLAALYHDVGRFDQYVRYKTFKDPLSENHGALGVKVLRRTRVLRELDRADQVLVAAAVVMHNRCRIPARVGPDYRVVTNLVRDADKLDIVRVMLDYIRPGGKRSDVITLHLANEPGRYTPELVRQVEAGRLGDYRSMRYINDFCLLLLSWTYDLNFRPARRTFLDRGYLDELFSLLPVNAELTRLKDRIYSVLQK
ncbi:HD domain-containing protein [Fundidesulfovibrio butyratiphilus]